MEMFIVCTAVLVSVLDIEDILYVSDCGENCHIYVWLFISHMEVFKDLLILFS